MQTSLFIPPVSRYYELDFQIPEPENWVSTLESSRTAQERESEEYKFDRLCALWKKETMHLSVVEKRYRHAAYKEIIAMKEAAIPLIFKEMRRNPDRWFDALEKLTGEDPAKNAETFYEAIDDWEAWGIANGYVE